MERILCNAVFPFSLLHFIKIHLYWRSTRGDVKYKIILFSTHSCHAISIIITSPSSTDAARHYYNHRIIISILEITFLYFDRRWRDVSCLGKGRFVAFSWLENNIYKMLWMICMWKGRVVVNHQPLDIFHIQTYAKIAESAVSRERVEANTWNFWIYLSRDVSRNDV